MEEEKKEITEETKIEQKEKVGSVRKLIKFVLYFILGLFVLNSILYATLSIPAVQNKLIAFVSEKLSSMLNTKVTVDEVRFSLFNTASLKGLYIEDQAQDTLAYAQYVGARISPLRFFLQNEIRVNKVELEDFYIHISAPDSISNYNFQFIIDTFSSSDSTTLDTTSSTLAVVIDDIKLANGRLSYLIKGMEDTLGLFNPSDIYITDLNANLSIHSIDMKNLDIHVNSISAKEKSGLELSEIKGHITSEGSNVKIDKLSLSLPNSHLETESLSYDLETEEFEIVSKDTKISPQDLQPFMSELQYLEHDLVIGTTIRGKLPRIEAEELLITYGNDASLKINASISDYADLSKANFNLNISELLLTPRGIRSFAKIGDPELEIPALLDSLGNIRFNGSLKGTLDHFLIDSKATMSTGSLTLLGKGNIDTTFTNFGINADLSTSQFKLSPLIGKAAGVDNLTMRVNLEASQKGAGNLKAQVMGRVDSLNLLDGQVRALPFVVSYDPKRIGFGADAQLHFGRIMAGFEMTTANKPDIRFAMRVKDIDVAHFYKDPTWKEPSLNFDVKGSINKLDIDNLNADILIKDLQFIDSTNFNYQPGPIELKAWQDSASQTKYIRLNSSIASANIEGDYYFSSLADEFSELMHNYLSNIFPATKAKLKNENNFSFDFTLNNTEELGAIFDLPFDITSPLTLNGLINTKDKIIHLEGEAKHAHTSSIEIDGMQLRVNNKDSTFVVGLNSDIDYEGSKYGLAFAVEGANNSLTTVFIVESDKSDLNVNGTILAQGDFTLDENKKLVSTFNVLPSRISIGQLMMNTLPARIINSGGRTEINNFGIGINKKEYLSVDGAISPNRSDTLSINFNEAQVADILQGIGIKDIYAEIDGHILATNILEMPELYTQNLKIKDITLYKDTLGTIDIDTQWNPELGGIKLLSTLSQKGKQVMDIDGLINPSKETMDLHMDIERFSIAWLKPFTVGLLTEISGDISSHLTVKGKFSEPITEGFLGFNNTKIGIDYTNVTYHIADTINIDPKYIGFDNLLLKDNEGNTARVNARVTHRNFQDIKYKLDMRAQNLMVLNTRNRTDSLFYGKLFASGTVNIDGSDKGINLNMKLRNGKKSNINVTIPQVAEATDYKSVVYINVPEEKLPKKEKNRLRDKHNHEHKEMEIPIKLKLKLDVDPNLELGVVIDPETGDNMNIKGNGTIDFTYDMSTEDMKVYGDYKATDGAVKLNLKNIARLEFKIKEGSKLNFIGDPFQTKFDITAYRRVRADLRTLDKSFEMDNSSPRVQADCLLGISGNINKMDLSYDVELFDGSDDQKRKVKSLINTDEQRIKQFAYLVASGMFYSNTGGSGANFSDGMWTNLASSALSSGLNAVLGNMLGEGWEVGTDLSSGDGSFSNMDMSVNATKRLFNDKLKIHANVGYRTDASAASDNSFIGDFDVEYALNSIWTLKAYSHTNDRFYRQAPTTQGVGIVFTREGSTFKRMFQSFKKRRGNWYRQERDSLRRIDSLRNVEKKLHLHKDNVTDTIKVDSATTVQPTVQKNSTPTNKSKKSDSIQAMPMLVITEEKTAWRREGEE